MRTTIDVDEQLLKELRAEARRQRCSLRKILNLALRKGLQGLHEPSPKRRAYRCPTFAMGLPIPPANLDKAMGLADTLEDTELARKLEMRK